MLFKILKRTLNNLVSVETKKQPENIFPIPSPTPVQQLSSNSDALHTHIQISVLHEKNPEVMDNDGKKNYLKLVSLIELPFQHDVKISFQ